MPLINMSAADKHQVSQMTGLNREKLDEVLEAIDFVRSPTPMIPWGNINRRNRITKGRASK